MKNEFWRDVLEAFAAFSRAWRPELAEMLYESIWFSDYTKFKLSVVNAWERKGIRFLADLKTFMKLAAGDLW